jgi:anthranilate phosphoribosyltransferase
MMVMDAKIFEIADKLYAQKALTQDESHVLFDAIIKGDVDPILLSAVLTALKIKGETPAEIAGAASALLANAKAFPSPEYDFADIVGTGGDGANTINISTTAAFVAAACGVKVAKHGNRGVSSKSGSSDLLDKFGINLAMTPENARGALDELGVCFLFAPEYHSGVRHAMPVRQTLKTRTIFNVLGPLINPARPKIELMIDRTHPLILF